MELKILPIAKICTQIKDLLVSRSTGNGHVHHEDLSIALLHFCHF